MGRMEMILVLHNIRSAYNVGAILRTAEGFGVAKVILSGWTPATKWTASAKALPHVLEKTTAQIAKTALGAEKMMVSEWSDNITATLLTLKKEGFAIFGLENNLERDNVIELKDWRKVLGEPSKKCKKELGIENKTQSNKQQSKKNGKCVLLLGEEVEGIDDSLFPEIDWFLEIPMHGQKESFNVSVAAGIAVYELLGRD